MLEKLKDMPGTIVRFLGDLKVEMKKVTWPGRNEVYGTTIVVLVTVIIFGIYLFLVDSSLQVLINQLFSLFL
jgi:preprotein translocase subunit SecE